jgi:hypothetical protein
MNWRKPGVEEPDQTKIALGIGMALGVVVLCWIVFARSGEESVSSNGFRDGGAGRMAAAFSAPRRAQASPSTPQSAFSAAPSSVKTEALPGAAAALPAAPAPAPAAAPTAPPPAPAPVDPRELAAAGVPTDAKGLARLGAQKGMLTTVIGRLLDHPRVLAAIFNNKMIVDAVMDRDVSRRNCADAHALAGVLSSPNSGPAKELLPLVSRVLSHPDAASAFATSEMGNRLLSCPSVSGLAHDQAALTGVVTANPQALSLLTDPRLTQALAANPEGGAVLSAVESGLGGGMGSAAGPPPP